MKFAAPPVERTINFNAFEVNAGHGQIANISVPVDEAPNGEQILPVGVYWPQNGLKHPVGTVAVRTFAWSAANAPEYQRARNQLYADVLGLPLVAPNTIGQGEGSPDLTARQIEELHKGKADSIGHVMVQAARTAYENQPRTPGMLSVILIGDSQGPSLHPAMIRGMADYTDVSHVLWATPAGVKAGRPSSLFGAMARTLIPGQDINVYRRRNPEAFKIPDTKIVASLHSQRAAHMSHYPALMRSGTLADDMKKAMREHDVEPEIHNFVAEHDSVSPWQDNLVAAGVLEHAITHMMQGHYHPVTEYMGYMAAQTATALGVDVPKISPPQK
jgi:hypothetical protein